MDEGISCPDSQADPQGPQRRGPHVLLMVINGVVAALGSIYLTTESIAVTIVAGAITLVLVALYRITQP